MSQKNSSPALQDAFQDLLANGDPLDATILEATIHRYPQFTTELTEFAVEWVLQDQLPEGNSLEGNSLERETPEDSHLADTSAVPAALDRFRQQLDARDAASARRHAPPNPFESLSPAELLDVAATVGLDKILLAKLRDRRIVADTLPASLSQDLASALQVPAAVINAHLAAPASVPAGLSFKSTGHPEAGSKESFTDAVQRSSLDDEAKAGLLTRE